MPKKAQVDKAEVARLLSEMSVFLELLGENPFRARAYANAARTIEALPGDLAEMVESGALLQVKGIGKSIFEHIETLLNTGRLPQYEEMKSKIPPGLIELLSIPGMGPKKAKAVYDKLGVTNIGELEYACLENRLVELEGFGAKSQEKILSGIENLKKYRERHLLSFALEQALPVYESVSSHPDVIRYMLAGSLRRSKETIKDIDIVVSARKSDRIMDHFTSLKSVERVEAKGKTKSSVILDSGINADLRVVSDKEFPYAVHHFTGSKDHNHQMRSRAKKMGIKMNEYGLFKGEKLIACKDEEEIFAKLGLTCIPPELREGGGEIEAAEAGTLPQLLEEKDIKGIFHVHTTYSDGTVSIEEYVRSTKKMGLEYVGIADHSQSAYYAGGLKPADVRRQKKEIEEINNKRRDFRVFFGIESDILPDGSLDYDPKMLALFDFVVVSVHSNFGMSEGQMTKRIIKAIENPFTTMFGHPTGRLLLAREGYKVDLDAVIDAAAESGVIIELNANPHRFDLDWRYLKIAKEKGVKIAINPDAHHIEGIEDYRYGVNIARKGWLEKGDVVNTLSKEEVSELFARLKEKRDG